MHLEILACQHAGSSRTEQQDAIAIGNTTWQRVRWHKCWHYRSDQPLLASVADGVSASTAPAQASRGLLTALHGLPHELQHGEVSSEHLEACATQALHAWNLRYLNEGTQGASTTLATVLIDEARAAWLNCGDSRIYHVRQEGAAVQWHQLSHDHTIWNELLADGIVELTPGQEAPTMWTHGLMHSLTLGNDAADPEWASGSCAVSPGDCLILCTDGIHGTLTYNQMQAEFDPTQPLDNNAKRWWQATLAAGAPDNFSFVFCRFCAS